jgi:sulfur carrier protein ThiS
VSGQLQVRVKSYGRVTPQLKGETTLIPSPGYVADVLASLGVPATQFWLIRVNGSNATAQSELHDGDLVELIPPIGGG